MKMDLGPKSRLGRWAVGLTLSFFVFLGVFFIFASLGEKGGDTIFSNLKLTIPMLVAAASGICSFFTGLMAIVKNKERSVSVFLATLIGSFVLVMTFGEVFFPD